MSRRGQISGIGRADAYDYPVEALREAVTNALMHRDYSPYSRGTQTQIEMYQDRLEIRNPGGLFGTVTEDDLGQEGTSSSRNSWLARLLQDVTLPGTDQVVCENRGTGIPAMIQALRAAGMTAPRFDSRISRFQVTFPRHALLDADTLNWIASLGEQRLSDGQCMALALMRDRGSVTNGMLRQLGLERHDATAALADLVGRGLALRFGGRRYARYVLAERVPEIGLALRTEPGKQSASLRRDRTAEIDQLFDVAATLRKAEVMDRAGLSAAMVNRYLNRLIAAGRVEPTAGPQARNRAYRRAGRGTE
jgi:ATP-dependent DNA helicase RecG